MGLLDDAIREHLELKRRRGADATEVAQQEHEALGPVRAPAEGPGSAEGASAESDPDPGADSAPGEEAGAFEPPTVGPEDATLMHPAEDPEPPFADVVPADPELGAAVEPEPEPGGPPFQAGTSDISEVEPPVEHWAPGQQSFAPGAEEEHAPPGDLDSPPGPVPADSALGPPGPETVEYDVDAAHSEEAAAGAASPHPPEAPLPPPPQPPGVTEPPPPADPTSPVPSSEEPAGSAEAAEPITGPDPTSGSEAPPTPPSEEGEDVLEETPEFLQETPEHDRLWFEQRPPRDFDFDK